MIDLAAVLVTLVLAVSLLALVGAGIGQAAARRRAFGEAATVLRDEAQRYALAGNEHASLVMQHGAYLVEEIEAFEDRRAAATGA